MTIHELKEAIKDNIEILSTTEGDEIECIGIENLEGILSKYLKTPIKLSQDGNI